MYSTLFSEASDLQKNMLFTLLPVLEIPLLLHPRSGLPFSLLLVILCSVRKNVWLPLHKVLFPSALQKGLSWHGESCSCQLPVLGKRNSIPSRESS